jgi:type IV secretion system protein VirB10
MSAPWTKWLRRYPPPDAAALDASNNAQEQRLHENEAQRGRAAVSSSTSLQGRLQGTAGLLLLGSLGAGLLGWYYASAFHRVDAARTAVSQATAARADADAPLPPLGPVETPKTAAPSHDEPLYKIGSVLGDPLALPLTDGALTPPQPIATPPGTPQKSPRQLLQDRLLAGAVFARPTTPTLERAMASEPEDHPRTDTPAKPDTALSRLLAADLPAMVSATVLPTQRLLLPKGSTLDCTLETAIDSTLPGLTTCLTAVDTFSADGTVVLLERGTQLIGETRGDVAQGASRIFVLWTEARTPKGVVVPLASPGTDELGRSGLPGTVDRHFRDRFGAAILMSIIDGAVQAAAAHQAGNNGALVLNPSGTRDITTEVLKSTINIPPTVRKPQGDRIQILVARDLDFRSVYALTRR